MSEYVPLLNEKAGDLVTLQEALTYPVEKTESTGFKAIKLNDGHFVRASERLL